MQFRRLLPGKCAATLSSRAAWKAAATAWPPGWPAAVPTSSSWFWTSTLTPEMPRAASCWCRLFMKSLGSCGTPMPPSTCSHRGGGGCRGAAGSRSEVCASCRVLSGPDVWTRPLPADSSLTAAPGLTRWESLAAPPLWLMLLLSWARQRCRWPQQPRALQQQVTRRSSRPAPHARLTRAGYHAAASGH